MVEAEKAEVVVGAGEKEEETVGAAKEAVAVEVV